MKKLTLSVMTTFVLLVIVPMHSKAASEISPITMTANKPVESAHARILLNRLDEINALDKSGLSSSEKKSLRKEARAIKSELKRANGGVYLSVGAIIIIVLLLILLL